MIVNQLEDKIKEWKRKIQEAVATEQDSWESRVREMERDSQIKSRELLWNSSIVLSVVILLFFVHSIPSIHLGLGWIAVLGASMLCVCE